MMELVTGMLRVSAALAVSGVKVTVMAQVAAERRVEQVLDGAKLELFAVGAAIWRVAVPVFLRVMVCCVADAPGTLSKISEAGVRERPGSGAPKPVRAAVTVCAVV